jgi:hypothetical protein
MKSQIYTPEMTRDLHIRQINDFIWPFYFKILPQFQNIESEAEQEANDYWERLSSLPFEEYSSLDPSIIAEQATNHGIDHYMMMNLGLYTATVAWHATLFEFFHQQLRLFLFDEMRHCFKIELPTFCSNFAEIKKVFSLHNFDVTTISSWEEIYELQILCNTIKHGDGKSLEILRRIAPARFKYSDEMDLFNLYKTTLLEITLDINNETLDGYRKALINFWNKLPERLYSDEL